MQIDRPSPRTFRATLLAAFAAAGASTAYSAPAAEPVAEPVSASALVQDDEKPDKRPEIKELTEKLKGHMREKGDEDRQAIETIDAMLKEFPNSGPKDREAIVKTIGESFKQKRKPNKEGVRDNQLYRAAAIALGELAPESVPVLSDWIDHKDHRDDLALQRDLILALGKSKHEDAVKPLLDLLVHHQQTVQAAAAEALGNFAHLPQEARKDVFKAILDQLTAIKGQVDSDPNDTTARERYDVVREPMRGTLRVLSKQDFAEPSEWRSWWNNNKKKDWDAS